MPTMTQPVSRSLDQPDETVEKGGVKIDVVYLGDLKIKRATYPTGWRFSRDMGAERCQDTHVGYVIAGSITGVTDDGTEFTTRAGDVFIVPAGHDAWCDDECTLVQFDEGESAARRFGLA